MVFASYLALFTLLAAPVLGRAGTAISAYPNLADSPLIVWILTWTNRALRTSPGTVFDAPISYPAPAQLTGSEHLFAAQLLFTPLLALTGNPVLATNLTGLLLYPLSAFAMERLLRALGFSAPVAWSIGLWFALSPPFAPFNIQTLQYPPLWYPLVALAWVGLRESPRLGAALRLSLAYGLAIFSSYYSAVLVTLTSAIFGASELLRPRPRRARFVLLGLLASALPVILLALAMQPYLIRGRSAPTLLTLQEPSLEMLVRSAIPAETYADLYRDPLKWLEAALALIGIAGALSTPAARRVVVPGLAISAVASYLRFGFPAVLGPWLLASPLRSLRYLLRFGTAVCFGRSLLWAAGLQVVVERAGARRGWLAPALVAASVLASLGLPFPDVALVDVDAIAQRRIYGVVAEHWRAGGGGALLELPLRRPPAQTSAEPVRRTLEPDAMIASAIYGWPTPAAYTGYHAPHRQIFLETTARLPSRQALEDLVDMTHVRWLLVRGDAYWPSPKSRSRFLAQLGEAPGAGRRWDIDGWTLVELRREPAHPRWFETIASGGPREGETVLGTPWRELDRATSQGRVTLGEMHVSADGGSVWLPVKIRNEGKSSWPVVLPPLRPLEHDSRDPAETPTRYRVLLLARWSSLEGSDAEIHRQEVPLDRDIDPGESLEQVLRLSTPAEPGRHRLELQIVQSEGPRLDRPGPWSQTEIDSTGGR